MGIIAQAAVELSEISKAAAKGPDWKWVQVKLEDKFGNDGQKEVRCVLWRKKRASGSFEACGIGYQANPSNFSQSLGWVVNFQRKTMRAKRR